MPPIASRLGITRVQADESYQEALKLYERKNLSEAILKLNDAIALQPVAEYHAARGWLYHEDGNRAQARADYDAALRLNPYELLANFGLGRLAYEQQEFPAALELFTKAWAANPKRAETLYYLGIVCLRLHQAAQAHAWFVQARAAFEQGGHKTQARDTDRWIAEAEKTLPPT